MERLSCRWGNCLYCGCYIETTDPDAPLPQFCDDECEATYYELL